MPFPSSSALLQTLKKKTSGTHHYAIHSQKPSTIFRKKYQCLIAQSPALSGLSGLWSASTAPTLPSTTHSTILNTDKLWNQAMSPPGKSYCPSSLVSHPSTLSSGVMFSKCLTRRLPKPWKHLEKHYSSCTTMMHHLCPVNAICCYVPEHPPGRNSVLQYCGQCLTFGLLHD